MKVNDFHIGDAVIHRTAGYGVVVAIAVQFHAAEMGPAVEVEFPPSPKAKKRLHWKGAYPQCWLDQHPGWLVKRER